MIRGENGKIALVTRDFKLTYKELGHKILSFAEVFKDIKQKHIAIFSENRPEWIYAFYASWLNKCTPIPIDYMAGTDDVSFILNDSKPELIFCSEGKYAALKDSLSQVSYEPRIVILEKVEISNFDEKFGISFEKNDTAVIIYTSGTTGNPKGVMLSFDNLIANVEAVTEKVKIILPNDRLMILLPLHHIFPLLGTLVVPFYIGASIAICPSLSADDIIKTLQQNKISILIGVPRLFSLIRKGIVDRINQKKITKFLFSFAKSLRLRAFSRILFKEVHQKFGGSVRHVVSGGAALDPEVAIDFRALGFDILEGYGMTESAPMICFTRPGRLKPGSAGQAVPGLKVEIRRGEIVVSGRNIMQGYYQRPDETNEILRNGWLYTGDLGHLDKKGYLHITGRRKEIIVLSNGKNINPVEIENKLEQQVDLVKECGVFLHHDKLSVVIVPDMKIFGNIDTQNIEKTIRKELIIPYNEKASVYKRILKTYFFYDELPRTRLGKLQRFKLNDYAVKSAVINEKHIQTSLEDFKELKTLTGFLEEQTGDKVFPEDVIETDLALDSLSKVTLLVYIENTFGVDVKEEQLPSFDRVIDLAHYIREHKTKSNPEIIHWRDILKEKIHFNLPRVGFSFNIFNWMYRLIFNLFLRLKAEGHKNLPEGPFIIAPNHQSFIDGFVLASLLKRKTMKKTFIYAKEIHWKRWWQRFLARKNNVILMDINKDLKLSIQKMAEVLKRGRNLIIFPEGTRSEDGRLGDFKKTFAILARELNVPVVPVVINGAYDVLPSGSRFPRLFRKVTVHFLAPVYPLNESYEKIQEKVRNMVLRKMKN